MPDDDRDHWDDDDPVCAAAPVQEITCSCACGQCCRMIIEVELSDAEREPLIAARGSQLKGFDNELVGYTLNNAANDWACTFLDRATNRCTIHATRPDVCREFDCDGAQRAELVELGILPPKKG